MRYWHDFIDCSKFSKRTKRLKPFCVIGYKFSYSEDRELLDEIIRSSEELAKKVFTCAANDSIHERTKDRLFANCLAGVSSEYCWRHFLNFKVECVRATPFLSASNQVDLEIIVNKKKVEVRSSFPRNGAKFAICHPEKEFDILGPYSNTYKPGEIEKHYFIRTLFELEKPTDIIKKVRSEDFILYLTGGATREMMLDPNISIIKDLIPEDSFEVTSKTSYRVVPFHMALDSKEIYNLIINEK